MDIYNYNPGTKEYIPPLNGIQEIAELDPLAGQPMIPGHATNIPVPEKITGKAYVFNGTDWDTIEDNRGIVYDINTKEEEKHVDLGPLPSRLTSLIPSPFDIWNNTEWLFNLHQVKTEQKNIIKDGFENDINTGYNTTSGIVMDSKYNDIIQLDNGIRLAEVLKQIDITIRDFNNKLHTVSIDAAKMLVEEIGINYQTILTKKWTLQDKIDRAKKQSTIQEIVWN